MWNKKKKTDRHDLQGGHASQKIHQTAFQLSIHHGKALVDTGDSCLDKELLRYWVFECCTEKTHS